MRKFIIITLLFIGLFLYNRINNDKIIYIMVKAIENVIVAIESSPESITDYFEPIKCEYCWNSEYSERIRRRIFTIEESDEKSTADFELYESTLRQGFYEYYVWINTVDTGIVYLKAVKIGNLGLLAPLVRLDTETRMEVHNQSDGFVKCGPMLFMIHQTFWLRSYLAMFELWYEPKNGGANRKLATKIYKVKGFID
jgi:hypothetical protein